ncbi:unnamed protein product [Pleuronectes platessa]|uniref:Uncharacterized protein n=1 Tax=Pleuronectes platessa TaxID=8262 RepID=A0A9N7UQC1_PLEPL|nr:unnamed protein product [Pleuronectes platessa]
MGSDIIQSYYQEDDGRVGWSAGEPVHMLLCVSHHHTLFYIELNEQRRGEHKVAAAGRNYKNSIVIQLQCGAFQLFTLIFDAGYRTSSHLSGSEKKSEYPQRLCGGWSANTQQVTLSCGAGRVRHNVPGFVAQPVWGYGSFPASLTR